MPEELNLEGLNKKCRDLVAKIKSRQIILLSGDLGAGKTTLVQSFVVALGGGGALSPTFSLINEYPTPKMRVFHVDLYRLEDEEDLESTGFWDLFEWEEAVIFIEWPEKIPQKSLPLDWPRWKISIEKNASDVSRSYSFIVPTGP